MKRVPTVKEPAKFEVGDIVYFHHQTENEEQKITEVNVGWAGDIMVTLAGHSGEFNQNLFKLKKKQKKYWVIYTSETDEACSHKVTEDKLEEMQKNDDITIHEVNPMP